DAGIAELERAYEMLPHPHVLYNIARAYGEAGRYEEAIEYFERYLANDPADRVEVRGFIEALEARRAAQAPTSPTTAPATATPPPAPTTTASSDEVVALEESATQIETLGEATDSDVLRQRAVALRELAAQLRAGLTLA